MGINQLLMTLTTFQSRAPISARLVANMLQTAGANRKPRMSDNYIMGLTLLQTL